MVEKDLSLYHGTDHLDGNQIQIRSNIGIGSNDLTLGNGFYTTTSKEIALFYSHVMMREKLFHLGHDPEKALTGKVYNVSLAKDLYLLRETDKLDVGAAVSAMKHAGIQISDINMLTRSELASFPAVVDFIEIGGFQSMNAKEYLTRSMGFDGLFFVQKPYLPLYLEADHIGVNWERCWNNWCVSAPATVVIYNTEKICSVERVHDGGQSGLIQLPKALGGNLDR
ncbi:hypothetical protein [Pedobacter endophyticus]|uniref:Uncharacterized protein n=1 Tax=Pedobacter endophyticus TaxID=2789740 RepID=A0A7S9L168_9SPHI|nr:hypothetical protein [Pedobacter endophyticus]QPH40513.1 hypothetical protein IZT61_04315 [Pedobacter endophyticus]